MPKAETPAVKQREPLHPIITTTPFQMVSMDFLHLESSAGGYQYILVVMDHFTWYVQAYATKDKSAKTAAEKLYNDFILQFGLPETTHHDQGGEFENKFSVKSENGPELCLSTDSLSSSGSNKFLTYEDLTLC